MQVDEAGTTAAAATVVLMMRKSAKPQMKSSIDFQADHPFLFVLSQNSHPLFIGIHN
ncbi:hypothetical protein CRE_05495 [Caenorhabditis remanei]|uniref:Serpin domain-containing protein n=1 Tax=Caenorhabditis remanei TaxID=31234 RepID=E3LZK7_CAERE|nr:hypothetical protein CRE_05495 [Caenorhabditis remanei]